MLFFRQNLKLRGAFSVTGRPREEAYRAIDFKGPTRQGGPGGLPLVATILPDNSKNLRIFVPNIRTDYFIVLDFCDRSKITKSPSIITETGGGSNRPKIGKKIILFDISGQLVIGITKMF